MTSMGSLRSLKRRREEDLVSPTPSELPEHREVAKTVKHIVEQNSFNIGRGFGYVSKPGTYAHFFGDGFVKTLNALPPEKQWTDVGAGLANAQRDFLKECEATGKKPPKMLAMAVKKPDFSDTLDRDRMAHRSVFSYMEKPIETIRKPPVSHVITDLYGAFSYTDDLSTVVQKYADMLPVGGIAWVLAKLKDIVIYRGAYSGTTGEDGRPTIDAKEWLLSIRGMKVSYEDRFDGTCVVKMVKIKNAVFVPVLHFEHFKPGVFRPPVRVFSTVA